MWENTTPQNCSDFTLFKVNLLLLKKSLYKFRKINLIKKMSEMTNFNLYLTLMHKEAVDLTMSNF